MLMRKGLGSGRLAQIGTEPLFVTAVERDDTLRSNSPLARVTTSV